MKKSTLFSGVAALALFALVSCGGEKTAEAVDSAANEITNAIDENTEAVLSEQAPDSLTVDTASAAVVEEVVAGEAQN